MFSIKSLSLLAPFFLSSLTLVSSSPQQLSLYINQVQIEYRNIDSERDNTFVSETLSVNFTVEDSHQFMMVERESVSLLYSI